MELRTLGRTGIRVSPLCLGTMMFGSWGNADHDESVRIIHAALDAGINFVDTADIYSWGESEEIVGKALADGRRDNVVLATKVHNQMGEDPNRQGNSRRWITTAVEESLRRLGTDHIDLYQIHRPDPNCDIDETLDVLSDLVHAGKVRAIGCSTFPAHQIVEAHWAAERRNHERFACEQPPYSILARSIEADVLPVARDHDMGVICWSPLAGGLLSGRYRKGTDAEDLAEVADEFGVAMIDLALGFVLNHPAVTSAIIGPRTMDQLTGQLHAPDVALSDDLLDRVDEIVAPGTNVVATDVGWAAPGLEKANRRR
jgi:aryl-alcohol dehydrogenase-like predicted oxidoreductase